jgi:hypothetical protein
VAPKAATGDETNARFAAATLAAAVFRTRCGFLAAGTSLRHEPQKPSLVASLMAMTILRPRAKNVKSLQRRGQPEAEMYVCSG